MRRIRKIIGGKAGRERLSCPGRGEFEITIRVLRSELEYDVDFETWAVGNVSGATGKGRAALETSEDTADWMLRQADNAAADIAGMLRAYQPKTASRAVTDETGDDREWLFSLVMEPGWRGDARTLGSHIHRYMVDSILAAWYRMTAPDRLPLYRQAVATDRENIIDEARKIQVSDVYFNI